MIGTLTLTGQQLAAMGGHLGPRPEPLDADGSGHTAEAVSSLTLVLRARAGDAGALNELCTRYLPRLQRWAHGRLPPSARGALDTHDLVQNTLARVVQRIQAFDPRHEGAFQAYVRQALLNQIRDAARHSQRRQPPDPLDSAQPGVDPSPLENAIGNEALERYEAALQRLRAQDRNAIIARVELGLSYLEIATELGKPSVPAAHVAVSRALVRLAKEMARERVR
jgi:RNA polymerase sigma-70 factor, ECF subfamily